MGWGSDTKHYRTFEEMRETLPGHLAPGAPQVLKRVRGHSGDGVWMVEPAETGASPNAARYVMIRVRHAKRESIEETMPLEAFMARCEPYFDHQAGMIDQIYQPRLPEGMVRCYLVRDRVEGFGEQLINALYPAATGEPAPEPGPRLYYPPTRPD
jgi:hypothetical protein